MNNTNNIRDLRKAAGLTIRQLSSQSGMIRRTEKTGSWRITSRAMYTSCGEFPLLFGQLSHLFQIITGTKSGYTIIDNQQPFCATDCSIVPIALHRFPFRNSR